MKSLALVLKHIEPSFIRFILSFIKFSILAVTSLLRLGIRLARKEDLASLTVQSLRILLAIKPGSILHVSKQVSYGLHELLKNNAANIHNKEDWDVVFTLLEVVGAGASPDIGSDSQNPDDDSGQVQIAVSELLFFCREMHWSKIQCI